MPDAGAIFAPLDRSGEVRRALFGVVERTAADGRLWCPPSVSERLIRAIALRDFGMVALSQGAVRLARTLVCVTGRDLISIVYGPEGTPGAIRVLTVDVFRALLRERVAGTSVFKVSVDEVRCLEPTLSTLVGGVQRPAVLPFARMPLQAAFLAMVMEALGHAKVLEILNPLLTDGHPSQAAHEVGSALLRSFDRWLTDHLSTAYHMRQQRVLRQALHESQRRRPDLIDDQAILDVWKKLSSRTDETAFKLYASVAGKLVALRSLARMLALGSQSDLHVEPRGHVAEGEIASIDAPSDWESPLVTLTSEPCTAVRWLTNTELAKLSPLVGATKPSEEGSAGTPSSAAVKAALDPFGPYDLALWRTLLRVNVFGAVQGRLVQAARDGRPLDRMIAEDGARSERLSYRDLRAWYAKCRRLLDNESKLVLAALVKASPERFGIDADQQEAVRQYARDAARAVSRQGLNEVVTPAHIEAYQAATPALVSLLAELDRLEAVLAQQPLDVVDAEDVKIFLVVFQSLYRPDAEYPEAVPAE